MTFEDYARARLSALLRTATAITGNPHLAEEIVQDVLIKVSAHWRRIEGLDNRDAYVRRMLVNEYISWRRKWSRFVPRHEIEPLESEADPATRIADRDLLRRELSQLPPKHQAVLALRYFEDLDDGEIADLLGCSASTARSYASRALARLRLTINPSTEAANGGAR